MNFNKAVFGLELMDGGEVPVYLEKSLAQFKTQEEYEGDGWDELPHIHTHNGYWELLRRENGVFDLLAISITTDDDGFIEYAMPFQVDVLWQLDAYKKAKQFATWYNENVAPFNPEIIEEAMLNWCSR